VREQEETDPEAGAGASGDSGAGASGGGGGGKDVREKGGEDDTGEEIARSAEEREQSEDEPADRPPDTPDAVPLGTPAPETAEAMTVVTRTAIRIAAPVLAVAGLYLVAWGYSPGGGFPGGAVILGVILLAYAGFGRPRVSRVVRPELLETLEMAGAAAIIMTELLGLVLKGSFSANWLPLAAPQTILSGGVAQLSSASELIEVGTGLTIAVFALLGMGHDWAPDKASKPDDGNSDPKGQNAGHGNTGHGSTGR
jgi:multicomponent Na+:H+ antiporter subunit B